MLSKLLKLLFLLILATPVITWWRTFVPGGNWQYELMRFAGLMAFTLIFLQLAIGSLMNQLRPILGYKLLQVHIWQGIVAFILALMHPFMLGLMFGFDRVLTMGGYAAWGRIGLVLLIVGVTAGLLRTAPWFEKYWRWTHRLNYVVLGLIYWHSWQLGSDVRMFPMIGIYYLAPVVFVYALAVKVASYLKLKQIVV